jgi:hypothetical protein
MEARYGDLSPDETDEVSHRKAQPGKPWGKPIENIMNLVDQRLRAKGLPGYRKRLKDAWENKVSQAELKEMIKGDRLMTIEEFVETFYQVVDEHNRAEKKLKEGGRIVPLDFFNAGLAGQNRLVLPDSTLDYICLPRFERKPHQCVVTVTMRGETRTFYSKALSGYKEKVRVSVDPYDRTAPAVLSDLAGEFIDVAEPWGVTHPNDTERLKQQRERENELQKRIGEQAKRLKEGFGLIPEGVQVTKVTPQTRTAKRAEKAKRVYEMNRENDKLVQKDHEATGREAVREIAADMAAQSDAFAIPTDGKERYRLWLSLDRRFHGGSALSPVEQGFYMTYQRDVEWKIYRDFHAEHGDLYIEEPQATALKLVN